MLFFAKVSLPRVNVLWNYSNILLKYNKFDDMKMRTNSM